MTTTTVVALDGERCLLVDPAMEPHDLAAVADWLVATDRRVAFGWSTHAHWDHVLWSSRFGRDVPRFATQANVATCSAELPELHGYIDHQCPGHEVELCGLLTPVRAAGLLWPAAWEVAEHRAHAPGHALLWLADCGVLIVGDMVSDIEIPTLDLDQADPLGDYRRALDLIEAYADRAAVFVPGHGRAGDATELRCRLERDRRYLDDLASGRPTFDRRIEADWLRQQHERQVARFAGD